jgi:putative transcriptional regulator
MTDDLGSGPGSATSPLGLTGRLLVASPALVDPSFAGTVVLVVDADESGALGVVLNRPTEVEVEAVLPPWSGLCGAVPRLFTGGPVSPETALAIGLLRTVPRVGEDEPPGWRGVNGAVGLIDLDTDPPELAGVLAGMRVFAGYAGWSAGQLEAEIEADAWYVVDALYSDVLTADPERLWRTVLRRQAGPVALVSTWTPDPTRN